MPTQEVLFTQLFKLPQFKLPYSTLVLTSSHLKVLSVLIKPLLIIYIHKTTIMIEEYVHISRLCNQVASDLWQPYELVNFEISCCQQTCAVFVNPAPTDLSFSQSMISPKLSSNTTFQIILFPAAFHWIAFTSIHRN